MAADPLLGKVLRESFEITERIGEGGTGVVYKAKQISVDRVVAIKVLASHVSSDPSWVKRFHNEARAAARLQNPHTVGLFDFGQTKEGLLFIAMEFLQGRALRDEIDKLGKVPPERALKIIVQACESVGEAHAQGIIHRDIKPDNLYLCSDRGAGDYVKVLDFSVAKLDDPNSQQTRAGVVFGTPCYMSPEQGRGAQLGPGSDIYAFGIVLYEMLSGKPPFDSKIPTEVVMMHLRDKPPPLQGVPDPIARLVMKTLDKDPAKRQKSCEQLAEECNAAFDQVFPHLANQGGGRASINMGGAGAGGGHHPAPPPSGSPAPAGGGGGYGAPPPGGGGGYGAPPPGGGGGYGAPPPGGGGYGAPPPGGGGGGGYGAPPPGGGGGGYGSPPAGAGGGGYGGQAAGGARPGQPEQRTMIAEAPQTGGGGYHQPSGGGGGGGGAKGTMMLPDSAGIIAFAQQQAEQARAQISNEQQVTARPAGPLFWAAWVVLGVGLGLAAHFVVVHKELSKPPAATAPVQ